MINTTHHLLKKADLKVRIPDEKIGRGNERVKAHEENKQNNPHQKVKRGKNKPKSHSGRDGEEDLLDEEILT